MLTPASILLAGLLLVPWIEVCGVWGWGAGGWEWELALFEVPAD